jgi:hypothetical protein
LTLGARGDGAFDFEPDRVAPFPTTDTVGVGPILERIRTLRDRWPAIERLVPSLDAPVSLVVGLRSETVTMDRSMWAAVASVDGHRSVRSIAKVVGDSAFEVAAVLAPLVDAGAVAINAVELEPITDGVFERGTLVAAVDPLEPFEPFEPPEPVEPVEPLDAPEPFERVGVLEDAGLAWSPDVVDPEAPVTEGPEALARLNRAELERAALGDTPEAAETPETTVGQETVPAPFDADADPDTHPAVPRDRGSLLRMFSALRDG